MAEIVEGEWSALAESSAPRQEPQGSRQGRGRGGSHVHRRLPASCSFRSVVSKSCVEATVAMIGLLLADLAGTGKDFAKEWVEGEGVVERRCDGARRGAVDVCGKRAWLCGATRIALPGVSSPDSRSSFDENQAKNRHEGGARDREGRRNKRGRGRGPRRNGAPAQHDLTALGHVAEVGAVDAHASEPVSYTHLRAHET